MYILYIMMLNCGQRSGPPKLLIFSAHISQMVCFNIRDIKNRANPLCYFS